MTPSTQGPTIDASATAAEREKQAALFIETRLEELKRVEDISAKLLTANADLCPFKKSDVGFETLTIHDVDPKLRQGGLTALGLSDWPEVVWVRAEGAAARAGLVEGDEILSINSKTIRSGARATSQLSRELSDQLEKKPAVVRVGYRRGAEEREAEIKPDTICGYDVELENTNDINAAATGDRIIINRGMLRFAAKDEELALVIAHELAHNAERHIRAKMVNALPGLALDVLAAAAGVNTRGAFSNMTANSNSAAFETEADYVGMYFMARAGYDTAGVEKFWRRMALESPRAIFTKSSHPTAPERFVAISQTHGEIQEKRGAGQPLTPNRKKADSAKPASTGR